MTTPATVTITSAAALFAAVKAAKPGDVVQVASGIYGALSVAGLKSSGAGVTIQPAPGAKVVVSGIAADNTAYLAFGAFEIAMAPKQQYGASVTGASHVSLDGLKVHQADGKTRDGVGVWFRNSDNVSLTNSELSFLGVGASALDCNGVTIQSNDVHDVATDGFDMAGSSNCTVDGNTGTDFFPATGAHPDFIQFWADADHPSPTGNVVTNNVYRRGKGTVAQGIFVENQSGIQVISNAMSGSMTNGISFSGVKGGKIAGNFVQGYADMGARIMTRGGSSDVTVSGNQAQIIQTYVDAGVKVQNYTETGNTVLPAAAVGDDSAMDAWLKAKAGPVIAPPPVAVTPPAPDARDAQIASLTAQLSAATSASKAQAEALSDAQAALKAANDANAALTAKIAAAVTALEP